jgi:hypothetical protein
MTHEQLILCAEQMSRLWDDAAECVMRADGDGFDRAMAQFWSIRDDAVPARAWQGLGPGAAFASPPSVPSLSQGETK